MKIRLFPPYTGGCIGDILDHVRKIGVSSLYGRVYRLEAITVPSVPGFLPIREGVSLLDINQRMSKQFPPYTGGCIVRADGVHISGYVSSLYGRVYRLWTD